MAKGGNWERDVCKFLSKWIQGTEKPYLLWRGSGSGATFTKDNLVGERFAGDIYHVREEGKFMVDRFVLECKSGYKEASLNKHLKYNKSDDIKDFWIQVTNDANRVNKYPMLIFKKKAMPTPWLGITYEIYNKWKKYIDNCRFVHLKWDNETELPDTYFFEYKEFFEKITPEVVKKLRVKK